MIDFKLQTNAYARVCLSADRFSLKFKPDKVLNSADELDAPEGKKTEEQILDCITTLLLTRVDSQDLTQLPHHSHLSRARIVSLTKLTFR